MPVTANLLSIIQDACDELGLVRPASVANSVDVGTRQLFGLANRDGRELQQNFDWTVLQNVFVINSLTPINTTGTTVTGSAIITNIPSTAAVVAGDFVCIGDGIPTSARVVSVDSSSQVTLNMIATADNATTDITFSQDTYTIPSDFDRYINETWWDRTNHWMLIGPTSPQVDQWHQSGIVATGPRRFWRQVGLPNTNWRIWPPPNTTDPNLALEFEYISQNWVITSGGVPQSKFLNDTDIPLIDPNAIIMGIKWRFFAAKGFDYISMQQEQIDYCNRSYAQDGGAKTLSMAGSPGSIFISPANVQDGSWPGPTGPNMS